MNLGLWKRQLPVNRTGAITVADLPNVSSFLISLCARNLPRISRHIRRNGRGTPPIDARSRWCDSRKTGDSRKEIREMVQRPGRHSLSRRRYSANSAAGGHGSQPRQLCMQDTALNYFLLRDMSRIQTLQNRTTSRQPRNTRLFDLSDRIISVPELHQDRTYLTTGSSIRIHGLRPAVRPLTSTDHKMDQGRSGRNRIAPSATFRVAPRHSTVVAPSTGAFPEHEAECHKVA